MAVLGDIEVTVQVDGQDLREFYDQDGNNTPDAALSKYIEAVSGARFQIVAIVSTSYRFVSSALGFEIFIDGDPVERGLIRREMILSRGNNSTHITRTFEGASRFGDSGWELRPFTFTEISRGNFRHRHLNVGIY